MLLKVIQNPGMQEVIDASMIEVCAKEGVSLEQVLFICCCLYHNSQLRKKSKQGC